MKPCRRCSRRSLIFRIYSLITVFILQFVSDIRRQRHLSQLIQNFLKDTFIMELDQTVSFVYYIDDLSGQ